MYVGTKMDSTVPKPFIFVLMPFDPKFNDIYKFGIKGAAIDVGAYAERIDDQIFTEGMLDRIFNQISKADVIVADMTGRNPNVFYEVGYAHAIGKIVLLLTQDSNDIPFDLKHRQHIVYGGSIDTLKAELTTRLEWAIGEAQRCSKPGFSERFSVRILGVIIPTSGSSKEVPILSGTVQSADFAIPIDLRNDSSETTSAISHVYLFCEDDVKLVPCKYKSIALNSWQSPLSSKITTAYTIFGPTADEKMETLPVIMEAVPLTSFTANPIDAPDGLTNQFRLEVQFPALPPGAVEESNINFMFIDKGAEIDSLYRIRLHSSRQYHDFSFRFKIKHEYKSKKDNPYKKDKSKKAQ